MGLIDFVIGWEEEVECVIEILNRRNKNNLVLIGEFGVGKIVVVEGLVLKIVEGKVFVKLLNKDVYLLDVVFFVVNIGVCG